jgi:hypothetical protein
MVQRMVQYVQDRLGMVTVLSKTQALRALMANSERDDLVQRALSRVRRPTKPMLLFLDNLFNDVGFTTRVQRNAYLSRELGREIKFLDDLTFEEGRSVINTLKERRDDEADLLKKQTDEEDEC